jgi:hypothetical protein
MCQATVRRNCRVVMHQGLPSGPGGTIAAFRCGKLRVEMIAERIELSHNLGGDMRLATPAIVEDAPKRVVAMAAPDMLRQALQNGDGLGHGGDHCSSGTITSSGIRGVLFSAAVPIEVDQVMRTRLRGSPSWLGALLQGRIR